MYSPICLLLLLLLLKPAPQAQVEKNRVVYKLFSKPHKHLRHGKRKQPTVNCILKPIQRSGLKHSVGRVIPHSNLIRQSNMHNEYRK